VFTYVSFSQCDELLNHKQLNPTILDVPALHLVQHVTLDRCVQQHQSLQQAHCLCVHAPTMPVLDPVVCHEPSRMLQTNSQLASIVCCLPVCTHYDNVFLQV